MPWEPERERTQNVTPPTDRLDSANSAVDVDVLMARLRDRVTSIRERSSSADLWVRALRGNVFINALEAYANIADRKAQIRTQWPSHIGDRFPFNIGKVRDASLGLLAFLFKDQRHVNVAIIAALREQIGLNRHLLEQIALLRDETARLKKAGANDRPVVDGDR